MSQISCRAAWCFFAIAGVTLAGCNSAGGQAAGLSGPVTMLPEYQARGPRKCSTVTAAPSAAQATVMVQCTMDSVAATGLGLVQDVKLELGKGRPFVYYSDAGLSGVDLTATVYPLRGSYTVYFCSLITNMAPVGQSCIRSEVPQAVGACWKTSFGDWKCKLQGAPGGSLPPATKSGAPQAF